MATRVQRRAPPADGDAAAPGARKIPMTRVPQLRQALPARLRAVREALGMTQRKFSAAANIPLPSLKDYEGGNSIPGAEALSRYAHRGADLNWLLRGDKGGPLLSRGEPAAAEPPDAGFARLRLYDLQARVTAGLRSMVETKRVVDALTFNENWIRQAFRVAPEDLRVVFVEGDSMEPDLRAGDMVLIDHTDTGASREGIYVVRMDEALLVKQLQRLPSGLIRVLARNSAYESFTVPIANIERQDKFAIIGRVVWMGKRL